MVDFKWIVIGLLLLFGGLFVYQRMTEVDVDEYQTYGFPVLMQGIAKKVENGELVDSKVRNAQHYLVYVASSESPDCKYSVADFDTDYRDRIEGQKKLEVVMYCLDSEPNQVLEWVKEEELTWPLLIESLKIVKGSHLPFRSHLAGETPYYLLLDKDGELVEKSKSYEPLLEKLEL